MCTKSRLANYRLFWRLSWSSFLLRSLFYNLFRVFYEMKNSLFSVLLIWLEKVVNFSFYLIWVVLASDFPTSLAYFRSLSVAESAWSGGARAPRKDPWETRRRQVWATSIRVKRLAEEKNLSGSVCGRVGISLRRSVI